MRILVVIFLLTSVAHAQSPARKILNNGSIVLTAGVGTFATFGHDPAYPSRVVPPNLATVGFIGLGVTSFLLNAESYAERRGLKFANLELKEMVPSMLFSFGAGVMRGYNHVTLSRADVFLAYHKWANPEWVDFTLSWKHKDSWIPGTFGDDMFHFTSQSETWMWSFGSAFMPEGSKILKVPLMLISHKTGQELIQWIYRR